MNNQLSYEEVLEIYPGTTLEQYNIYVSLFSEPKSFIIKNFTRHREPIYDLDRTLSKPFYRQKERY